MAFLNKTGVERLWSHTVSRLNHKVDKVDGKGLSTNDFTNEEKEKLTSVLSHNVQELTESEQAQARTNIGAVSVGDLDDYASKDYVDSKLGETTSDVTSVNGKIGDITLTTEDIGAAEEEHTHTKAEITDFEDLVIAVTDDNNGGVTLFGTTSSGTFEERLEALETRLDSLENNYATEEEIIAMMIDMGIISPTEETLSVDNDGNGTIANYELIVDDNNNGTINANLVVDENGNGTI